MPIANGRDLFMNNTMKTEVGDRSLVVKREINLRFSQDAILQRNISQDPEDCTRPLLDTFSELSNLVHGINPHR